MQNRIRINCKRVYDSGDSYTNYSEEIIDIQKRLKKISNDIGLIWGGAAGYNFTVSLNKHIKDFDAVVNFLGFNGELLRSNAMKHNGVDSLFASKMERSELDER